MKIAKATSIVAVLIVLAACVTINIYFPSAQAREAAEKIVDDIMSKDQEQQVPGSNDQSMRMLGPQTRFAFNPLNLLIPTAEAAAQPQFDANTPAVRKLQAAMKQRFSSLKPFYESGAIGFTEDALIGIRELSAVPLKQRGQLKNLVNAENQDRNDLYKEIARANGHPEWEKDIRQTFSQTWVSNAAKGWWYRKQGNWLQR